MPNPDGRPVGRGEPGRLSAVGASSSGCAPGASPKHQVEVDPQLTLEVTHFARVSHCAGKLGVMLVFAPHPRQQVQLLFVEELVQARSQAAAMWLTRQKQANERVDHVVAVG